jgi:hypothetical protein
VFAGIGLSVVLPLPMLFIGGFRMAPRDRYAQNYHLRLYQQYTPDFLNC